MAAAIGVRSEYTLADLRQFARRSDDADHFRPLLAVALILDGGSRSEAAKVAGVTLQIVRDWVLRFNECGPDGLTTRKAPGRAAILNDEQRARLAAIVEAGPIPAAHGVARWRLADLTQWIWDEFALSVMRHTLGRELRAMGYRKLSARPRNRGQKGDDIADFKKLRCPPGADQAAPAARNADRAVVAGRGSHRSANQAHPALGEARHAALGTQGSAALLGMAVRRDLSRRR
jgi:transposase